MKRLLKKSPLTLTLSPRSGGEGTAAKKSHTALAHRFHRPFAPSQGEKVADRPDEGVFAFRGVTLVEVLMSLMIMSIGISSVAVLFPISVLRSVQATQLTNAAILKTNAETLLQMRPELIFDPDGDGNFDEHVGRTEELHYIVDPGGYFEMATGAAFSTFAYSSSPWLNGTVPADPNDSASRGGADWFGNVDTNADGVAEPFAFLPRYDGGVRTGTINGSYPNGFQPQGGNPEEARALRMLGGTLSRLGDGWETQIDSLADSVIMSGTIAVGIQLPIDVDVTDVATIRSMLPRVSGNAIIPDLDTCRVVVFSVDGSFSVALPLVAVSRTNPAQLTWAEAGPFSDQPPVDPLAPVSNEDVNQNGVIDVRGLPREFINPVSGNFEVGRVLLQSSRTHDYNWLLTVRRGRDGQARGVDVVITHNKSITPDDERLYTASFDSRTHTPDTPAPDTPTTFNSPFHIEVFKDGGRAATGDIAEPALRKSGYVLDVQNARWYRVRDYVEQAVTIYKSGVLQTAPGYLISLETPVLENSPLVIDLDTDPLVVDPRFAGKAMFLPGVVDVYPMGSIPIPSNL